VSDESPRAPVRLTLYGRRYCHLCEEMLSALESMRAEYEFEIDVVDVDMSETLERRYGELVPVLVHAESTLCHYFLDRGAVTAYLAAFR